MRLKFYIFQFGTVKNLKLKKLIYYAIFYTDDNSNDNNLIIRGMVSR